MDSRGEEARNGPHAGSVIPLHACCPPSPSSPFRGLLLLHSAGTHLKKLGWNAGHMRRIVRQDVTVWLRWAVEQTITCLRNHCDGRRFR